jgi:hypothetical protein
MTVIACQITVRGMIAARVRVPQAPPWRMSNPKVPMAATVASAIALASQTAYACRASGPARPRRRRIRTRGLPQG